MNYSYLKSDALALLKKLIVTPSFSKEEAETASIIGDWLTKHNIPFNRQENNIWTWNRHFDKTKPTILLNSHHDTVKPNEGYTNDPFDAKIEDGKLFGLGSNDAGASLVALLAVFKNYYEQENMAYNLVIAATAEEEISGKNGIESIFPLLPSIEFALIGEPTEMNMAIAEKGLLVIDAVAHGKAGHVAHDNTKNAIHSAIADIQLLQELQFPKESPLLGKTKISVTQIQAGTQHNVVPDACHFVIDVRVNDMYSNEEVFDIIENTVSSKLTARSLRLNSSAISETHPIVQAGKSLGLTTYGSPTLSDQALLTCPSLKIGPGVSSRSHSANEFIEIQELEYGIDTYINLLNQLL